MKTNFKTQKGITLIALVITIIVLLILAGITINLTVGQNGIITTAQQAGKNYQQAAEDEQTQLAEFLQETTGTLNALQGKVNAPTLLTGMTAIKFTDPTSTSEGTVVTTTASDASWYNYDAKKWANAQTQDGSMWVWIPRFAYKINSTTQTVDVVFLIGTTDNYYKADGTIGTAQRATSENTSPDTTADYTVHPAFTNESSISYANGGWDSELTGIWVAKFEAGYAGGNNTTTAVNSSVAYTSPKSYAVSVDRGGAGDGYATARNYYKPTGYTVEDNENGTMTFAGGTKKYSWIDGKETYIKYPVFQGLTYSMNYITVSDAYDISRALTETGNIYGLSSSNADSHLIKNSEWGAVAYLSQSQYGLNGINIAINNVELNDSENAPTVHAVTGCASTITDASAVTTTIESLNAGTTDGVATWTQVAGTKASSTGTIYGIYDLSGGLWERTASYVANGNTYLSYFGNSLITETNRKYVMVYASAETTGTNNVDAAMVVNYNANNKIGDAIEETSTACTGSTSWYSDYSYFVGYTNPFFKRGAGWNYDSRAGLFSFYRDDGDNYYYGGFRPVLVAK